MVALLEGENQGKKMYLIFSELKEFPTLLCWTIFSIFHCSEESALLGKTQMKSAWVLFSASFDCGAQVRNMALDSEFAA